MQMALKTIMIDPVYKQRQVHEILVQFGWRNLILDFE